MLIISRCPICGCQEKHDIQIPTRISCYECFHEYDVLEHIANCMLDGLLSFLNLYTLKCKYEQEM